MKPKPKKSRAPIITIEDTPGYKARCRQRREKMIEVFRKIDKKALTR